MTTHPELPDEQAYLDRAYAHLGRMRARTKEATEIADNAAQEVTVQHALGCEVKLTTTTVSVTGKVSVDVSAPMVDVKAGLSSFSGTVKCQTLIAEQIVMSPAYTPGAGNVW